MIMCNTKKQLENNSYYVIFVNKYNLFDVKK